MYQYIKNTSLLKKYLFIGFSLHLISSYFSIGFYSDDEHYQILEPVAYLLGINDILLKDNSHWYWEWELKMRPWLQPYMYYYIISILKLLGLNNPFIWTYIIRLLSSIIGFISIIYLFSTFKNIFFKKDTHFNYLIFFSFWFFPFLHSRTSSENIGITLFIFSFCFLYKQIVDKNIKFNFYLSFISGIILGLCLVIKLNLIFSILPILLWVLIFKFSFKKILIISIGVLISLTAGLIIDSINYNEITFTYWNFFYWNIVYGRMAGFGVQPWWFYLPTIIIELAPVLSVFFIIGLLTFWIKKPLNILTFFTLSSLLIISLFGHKETRYAFIIYLFAPLFISYFFETYKNIRWTNFYKFIILFSNFLFLFLTLFTPANGKVAVYNYLYKKDIQNSKIYYLEENPYIINDMEPVFYTSFIPKINKTDIEEFNKNKNNSKFWILTNSYKDYRHIIKNNNCTKMYSSFPEKIINLNKNWQKHKFNWYIIYCDK